jgi:carboxynorspermidine decarboxylase
MKIEQIKRRLPSTPAFLYDEGRILEALSLLAQARAACGLKILYSVKALPLAGVLERVGPQVDGFAVSSLFEAKLAAEWVTGDGTLHITTPGLRAAEIGEIAELCDFIGFNSLEQQQRFYTDVRGRASPGLRINPQHSFLDDPRYDPCCPFSKLGVPLQKLQRILAERALDLDSIEGLHFHTSYASRSFEPLQRTVAHIEANLGDVLAAAKWINLGGGYAFSRPADLAGLVGVVERLRNRWQLDVYFEPGRGIVGAAGYLVASVLDVFEADGKCVAILDTSVNHHPEIFEYRARPLLAGESGDGAHAAVLAGCTCVSGDVFGEYRFARPVVPGERVVLENVGAYSLVKANRFNGYNFPAIYAIGADGLVRPVKRYDYEDYRRQWTA